MKSKDKKKLIVKLMSLGKANALKAKDKKYYLKVKKLANY